DGETFTIVCNMSGERANLPQALAGERVLGNVESDNSETLLPYETRVTRTRPCTGGRETDSFI
ncbi:MAG: hypothetical protein LLF75_09350, partial [Eubacteriales bacterium]|nr:hypothetical protein [Eubacteriales bacterium]